MSYRWLILLPAAVISMLSLLVLIGISPNLAKSQAIFTILGIAVYITTSQIDFDLWLNWRWLIFGGLIFLLILTMLIAPATRGSSRWIEVGNIHIQSSQLAVAVGGLVAAGWTHKLKKWQWSKLLSYLIVLAIPAALIVIQPDLDTTIIYLSAISIPVLLVGLSKSQLLKICLGLGLALTLLWFGMADYQKQRILSFVSPHEDLSGAGYNARQSLIAVGSGGMLGRGLGYGTQSQLRFLPERQTDFIFAVVAEEMGFAGTSIAIGLYAILIFMLLRSANKTTGAATSFIIMIAWAISTQVFVNAGMNIGLLPVTGITLPFLSYGGSALLSMWWTLGLAAAASAKKSHSIKYLK